MEPPTRDPSRWWQSSKPSNLERKVIHGVFYKEMTKDDCDRKPTHTWLQEGRLQSETESLIMVAQDTYHGLPEQNTEVDTRPVEHVVVQEKQSGTCSPHALNMSSTS